MATEAGDILVEEIMNQHGDPVIVPVTMDQDYLLKEFELSEGKVRCPDRRPALLAHDTQANVGFLQVRDQYLN